MSTSPSAHGFSNSQATVGVIDKVSKHIQVTEWMIPETKKPKKENCLVDVNSVCKATQTDIPPDDVVLSIDLLLSTILEATSDSDLMHNIRLVNFRWYSIATKILQARNNISITFDYDDEECRFICDELNLEDETEEEGSILKTTAESNSKCHVTSVVKSIPKNSLQAFIILLNNTQTDVFPVIEFSFGGGFLDAPDLQHFLNVHGSRVRRLILELYDDFFEQVDGRYSTLASFTKLLTKQVPFLHELCLDYYPKHWGQTYRSNGKGRILVQDHQIFPSLPGINPGPVAHPSPRVLLNLRVLDLSNAVMPSDQLLELLIASPKLIRLLLLELSLPVIDYLIRSNRLELLQQSFIFKPTAALTVIEAYEKFTATKTKVKEIEVNLRGTYAHLQHPLWPRIAQCLQKILNTCSESLHIVRWFTSGHLPYFFIPSLKNVKNLIFKDSTLSFDDFDEDRSPPKTVSLFPQGSLSLSSIFPNLVSVRFEHECRFDDSLLTSEDMFSEPLFTVQNLILYNTNKFSSEALAKLAKLFPKVTKAEFRGICNFPCIAKALWKFLNLKELVLGIAALSCHNQFPALDMGFTGFGAGTVKMLRVMSEDEIEQNLDKSLLVENPSIVELKDLVSLRLRLMDDEEGSLKSDKIVLMTPLSVDYGFRLIPKLVVCIDIIAYGERNRYNKILNGLDEIREYGQWNGRGNPIVFSF